LCTSCYQSIENVSARRNHRRNQAGNSHCAGRDLKDYITAAKGGIAPNPESPFNVKANSAYLSNFTKDDIVRLFAQRTAETGQRITAGHRRLLLYKSRLNFSKINPAGEPKARGGHASLAPGKQRSYKKLSWRKASVKCPPLAFGSPASSLCVVQPAFIPQ
jgi:hypothetical protein